jgi:hypothetical protein
MKTLEFRDGEQDVPDHVAILMKGLRTWEMTYIQAKAVANERLTKQALLDAQQDLIKQHFKRDGS